MAGDSCELFLLEPIYFFATTDQLFCYCRHPDGEYIFCEVIAGVAPTGDRRHRKACARCTPSCDALPRGAATMGGAPLHEGELSRNTGDAGGKGGDRRRGAVTGGEGGRRLRRCFDRGACRSSVQARRWGFVFLLEKKTQALEEWDRAAQKDSIVRLGQTGRSFRPVRRRVLPASRKGLPSTPPLYMGCQPDIHLVSNPTCDSI